MTVTELMAILKNYEGDRHIVVALTESQSRGKIDIHTVWADKFGVVNIIAVERADYLDAKLKSENNLS